MIKIGAQMYTAREFCKTPEDIAKSCAKVKAMGYDGIQASGMGTIDPAELRRILDGEGLLCAATHMGMDRMRNDPAGVVAEHEILGCAYTAIGGFFPKAEDWSLPLWEKFVADYNAIAAQFAGTSVSIGYHNHSHELAPAGGVRPLDLLIEKLDPSVWMEIDTYWIAHGGSDPAAYIDRVAGRIPCVHFKDLTITPARQHKMTEIGDGNLNWPRICTAVRNAGCEWVLVERDSGDLDPFDSLKRSVENIRGGFDL